MPKTRRLTDLFVRGKEVTIGDGEGAITVWVQKLNPVDQEMALRRANAARARILAKKKDEDSFEYQSTRMDIVGKDADELIEFLVADVIQSKSQSFEAELAAEDEWSKDHYLQGLRDSWNDGLKDAYHMDNDDEEAARVFAELRRFSDEVTKLLQGEAEKLRGDYKDTSDEELENLVFDKMFAATADMAWVHEYRRCEIWLGVRELENHKKRYFESRDEVDHLEQEVLVPLVAAYHEVNVDVTEGKGLVGTPPSSPSSEQSEKVETAPSSGRVVATV